MATNPQSLTPNPIIIWLLACATLVAAMVLVGGYTRLSGSGLSITTWKPIHGIVPPLNDYEWLEEFAAYQHSPQYQKTNQGMTLLEFKTIFWPEYFHRVLGRLIGIIFFVPLVVFALRRSFSRRFGWRLLGIFALGGLQGLIGWLMVASGLVDNPHVSHIRLALHLSVAFLIYGLIVWAILDVKCGVCLVPGKGPQGTRHKAQGTYYFWFALLCLQIILGALLAGLHGGLIYNTWPDMNGQMAPEGLLAAPLHENITLLQFTHRTSAILLVLGFLFWWYLQREYVKNCHLGALCLLVAAVLAVQFALGVATLLLQVPLSLALIHQMTALLLFTVALVLLHRLRTAGKVKNDD